jgi:hypothetical protein
MGALFTFKESLFVVRGFGAMSAGSIGRKIKNEGGQARERLDCTGILNSNKQ